MFIKESKADPKEVLFNHPKHGEWNREGFITLINGISDPRGRMHSQVLLAYTPKQIVSAFCKALNIDMETVRKSLYDGSKALTTNELYRMIVGCSMYARLKDKKAAEEGMNKVGFKSQGGRNLTFSGNESPEFRRLITGNYDETLQTLIPEFKSDSLRKQYDNAREKAKKLGDNFAEYFFEPGIIGQCIFAKLNQFIDFTEEFEVSTTEHLKELRELFLPDEVVRAALDGLKEKKTLSPLGKLIAGSCIEFIDAFVYAARSGLEDGYKFDIHDPLKFSLEQEYALQERLLGSDWFLSLTDFQFVQTDPEWAMTIKPSSLLAQRPASGPKSPGSSVGGSLEDGPPAG